MIRSFTLLVVFATLSFTLSAQHSYHCKRNFVASSKNSHSDTVDVLNYSIHLDLVYLSTKEISGYTDLQVTPKVNNVQNMKFDLLHMTIDSITMGGSILTYQYNDTLLNISMTTTMQTGDTSIIRVYYHGQPVKDPSGWGGFYFSNDSVFAFNLGVGMQDNPHNYGRVWYPCLDDFVDRATYDFHIRVKSQNKAICNGSLLAVTNNADGTTSYQWNLQHSIPTYLSSVAVGPYEAYQDTFHGIDGDIPIAIYVRSSDMSNVAASFVHLKDILAAYETCYGPYKWERVGYVGVPFSSGAMEHSTNIALGFVYMNGTLTYESLIAHELAHQWFGNLVTCSTAEDMWLNEGWAVFSESMYKELVYGRSAYQDNMRELLNHVILEAHKNDNGYRAVAGVPHEYTYGTTVYDKGGTVAHSLRGYLGDSLFFSMLKDYMQHYSYDDVSSTEFRDFISQNTGIDVTDFFDSWVFEPGFNHFQVDSFSVTPMSSPSYAVHVYMRQDLLEKPNYTNSNRVRIRFIDDQWNMHDEIMEFSGASGQQQFIIPINPIAVFTDPDQELADASVDYTEVISSTGTYDFPLSLMTIEAQTVLDSALLKVTHHWVAPEDRNNLPPGVRISARRFWSIEGVLPMNMQLEGKFQYNRAKYDNDLITNNSDSVVILYRPHGRADWQSVAFSKSGVWAVGKLSVSGLKTGDYVVASWDAMHASINDMDNTVVDFVITPNPAKEFITVKTVNKQIFSVLLRDAKGSLVVQKNVQGDKRIELDIRSLKSGMYLVELRDKNGNSLGTEKLIIR